MIQAHRIKSLHSVFQPSSGLTYKLLFTQFSPNQRCPPLMFPIKGAIRRYFISPDQDHSLPRLTTSLSPQKWCRQRESNSQPTDSYYYSFHYHFHVCSLDFLLTISINDLGSSYKVSTLDLSTQLGIVILTVNFPILSSLSNISTFIS